LHNPQVRLRMLEKKNLPVLIAAFLAIFFMGAFLQGERIRRSETKEQMKEIRNAQKEITQRIDSVYANALAREALILDQMEAARRHLDTINSLIQKQGGKVGAIRDQVKEAYEDLDKVTKEAKGTGDGEI
jgi:uncharacterized coiled-coil DUF342 family protein